MAPYRPRGTLSPTPLAYMLDTAVVSKIHTRRQKEIKKGKIAFCFENLERITLLLAL